MLNLDDAISLLEKTTGAKVVDFASDPADDSRVILKLKFDENITKINIETRRLRNIDKTPVDYVVEKTKESLTRKV